MTTNKPKISETQQEVLRRLLRTGAALVRLPGGFWTYAGCPVREESYGAVPEWSVAVQTVRAMEHSGLLRRRNSHAESWRDDRELTQEGATAAQDAITCPGCGRHHTKGHRPGCDAVALP